ncbi:hypothetical protein ACFQJ5_15590 [Halomicroarcula sp. GCM10025324]|uniref:hypothetical protein n=1 Tax=Haloarcula TaxID=2237 RepID=UPI0023E775D7|nr:hypothetical protein [Halomicroarcula sp. ZS-22-S1]
MDETVHSMQPFDQFVLLSVVELTAADATPAHSFDVAETAKDHLDDIDRDPFGGVQRQEVISALQTLADAGLLEKSKAESPIGKGRPGYELAVDAETVLDELTGVEGLGSYAETLRTSA